MSTKLLPTPETDAKQSDFVLADFARKLERERDTARRLLERCRHVNGLPYELYGDIQEVLNCDAHAELKAALAAGKVIQFRLSEGDSFKDLPIEQCGGPSWKFAPECYRVKPEGRE